MQGYAIQATDGVIGRVRDLLFDDASWVVRYFIVQTDRWLARRMVLISATSIGRPERTDRLFPASISKEQVRHSPRFDEVQPLSRADEASHLQHYGYPHYWTQGESLWGEDQEGSANLHSGNTVTGYQVHATDGEIGRIEGLLVEDKTWAIRYLVVSPAASPAASPTVSPAASADKSVMGHGVLIAPEWIDDIQWGATRVVLDVTRESVSAAPSYDPTRDLSRDVESRTYAHFGKDHYWRTQSGEDNGAELP